MTFTRTLYSLATIGLLLSTSQAYGMEKEENRDTFEDLSPSKGVSLQQQNLEDLEEKNEEENNDKLEELPRSKSVPISRQDLKGLEKDKGEEEILTQQNLLKHKNRKLLKHKNRKLLKHKDRDDYIGQMARAQLELLNKDPRFIPVNTGEKKKKKTKRSQSLLYDL